MHSFVKLLIYFKEDIQSFFHEYDIFFNRVKWKNLYEYIKENEK